MQTEDKTQPEIQPGETSQDKAKSDVKPKKSKKGLIVLVVAVLLVGLLAAGGFLGYRYYKQRQAKQKASQDTIQNQVIKSTEPVQAQPVFTK